MAFKKPKGWRKKAATERFLKAWEDRIKTSGDAAQTVGPRLHGVIRPAPDRPTSKR